MELKIDYNNCSLFIIFTYKDIEKLVFDWLCIVL